jgi:MoaA/NifB/PqqE/SkfB family radical SAM enzyme
MYNPTDVYYMITIECNQKCTKCTHWKQKDMPQRLPVSELVKAMNNIPMLQQFCILGGEPLLFKSEIYEILNGISNTSVKTVIITNGVLMDESFIQNISKFNIHVIVSIDTMDKDFWRFVRGEDSYDLVMKNLEYAIDILSSSQISIQSVLSKETQAYLPAVSEYAASKNIYYNIQDYITEGLNGSQTAIEDKTDPIPDIKQRCFSVDNGNLFIVYNGDVYTCFRQTQINDCQQPLGNLGREEITDILSSDYVRFVTEKIRTCNLSCKVLKCNVKKDEHNV